MEIHVFDRDFNIIDIVDSYTSCIWTPHYSDCGDFELYLPASCEMVTLLREDYYLVRSSDIRVVGGVTTYKNVMIIKNIIINTDVENGDYLTITGRELKFILNQRIVWKMTTLIGNVGECIYRLLNENAITPTDPARVLPYLTLDVLPDDITEAITKQFTGDELDKAIEELCLTYSLGYEVYVVRANGVVTMPFRLYKGVNRSYAQTDRPYVTFSATNNNLYNTEYIHNSEGYRNVALIGGEGEGTERTFTTTGSASGLDRYELFVDAKDISSSDNPDIEVMVRELATQITDKQAEITNVQAEITAQQKVTDEIQENLIKAEKALDDNQADINAVEKDISNLRGQLNSLKSKLVIYEQQYNDLTRRINKATKAGDTTTANKLKTQRSTVQKNIDSTRSQINDLDNKIESKNDELIELNNLNRDLKSDVDALNSQLSVSNTIVSDLHDELTTLNNQLASLNNQYSNAEHYVYIDLLKENGTEKLLESSVIEEFSGEVLADISYKLGVDYALGDIVSVVSEYGVTANSRISSIIESVGEDGSVTIVPNFGTWEV